jgi:type VI secretion system secreted protein VgrG
MADLRADTERFTFEVEGLDEELRVVRFQGSEAISQLFRFELTVAAESPDVNFEDVVNQPALLTVEGDSPRYVNGIVSRIELSGQSGRFSLYDVTVVPPLWRLKLRHDCRIFQEKAVKEIVADVLDKAGVPTDAFAFDLQEEGPARTYCVQYRESDWDFISRLLEEEGIHYFFEHTDTLCKLMMVDHATAHPDIEGDTVLPFVPASGLRTTEEHVTRFTYAEEVRPGKVTLTDYNFTKPSLNLAAESAGEDWNELEVYDYPGEYLTPELGQTLADMRLAALNGVRRTAGGEGDSPRLVPGYQFDLADHPREDLNAKYALTEVFQSGDQPQVLEERAGGGGGLRYSNRFECIPADTDFRPPRLTPKPVVEGIQTAIVVGPDGEEIYTDEFGRVKVQFHWDRLGQRDDQSSCWIRVSQSWAGAGWGAIHIPRIGQEVIVDFVEGDPDRPIVTGRVYHGTNRPPYALPDNKTQSGIKSDTSPGGGGSNELRFEDKAGAEEVFLHAQKDMTTAVENNQSTSVGANQSVTVKANQNITVEKERWDEVKEYHNFHVGGNQQISVDGEGGAGFSAVGPYTVSSEKKVEVFVGDTAITEDDSSVTVSAPKTITLVVGSSSIELTKDGVAISAKKITLAGTQEVKLQVGSSSVTVDAKGVSSGGPKISSAAVGIHEISGALIKIN